jgi:hypothetical protein
MQPNMIALVCCIKCNRVLAKYHQCAFAMYDIVVVFYDTKGLKVLVVLEMQH